MAIAPQQLDELTKDRKGVVYFIQSEIGGPVKIGFSSREVSERLKDIQYMSPFLLVLLGTVKGSFALEKEFHARFKHINSHGEWFFPLPELLGFIEEKIVEDWVSEFAGFENKFLAVKELLRGMDSHVLNMTKLLVCPEDE